jgi:hypothetical protein
VPRTPARLLPHVQHVRAWRRPYQLARPTAAALSCLHTSTPAVVVRLLGAGGGVLAVRDGGLDGALQLLHRALLRRRRHIHRRAHRQVPAVRGRGTQRRRRRRQVLPAPPPPPRTLLHFPRGVRTARRERVRPAPLLPLRPPAVEGRAQLIHHGRHVLLHPLSQVQRSLRLVLPLLLCRLLVAACRVVAASATLLPPQVAEAGEERRCPVLGPVSVVARRGMAVCLGVTLVAEVAADAADGGAGHGEQVLEAAEGRRTAGVGEVVGWRGGS